MTVEPLPLPQLSAPARRALDGAGITALDQLDGRPESEVADLHGVGPAQLAVLHAALAEHSLAMTGVRTKAPGATGRNDNATEATDADPAAFLESVPWPRRQAHGKQLLDLFSEVTGEGPAMWGPTMIGFGRYHYVYPTGREGDTMRVGFSPRKAALSLYGLQGHDGSEKLLARLGPHRLGAGCVYVTNLDRVDRGVLRELVALAWAGGGAAGEG